MSDKIIVSEKFRNYLEGLSHEKASRINLITFMLDNDMNNEQMFKKIQTEYLEFFIQYELAKRMLEKLYIKPKYENVRRWNLDFRSREITVNE